MIDFTALPEANAVQSRRNLPQASVARKRLHNNVMPRALGGPAPVSGLTLLADAHPCTIGAPPILRPLVPGAGQGVYILRQL